MVKPLEQHQVPDGMVGNVPWGAPISAEEGEKTGRSYWSDRMIERGLFHMRGGKDGDEGETASMFPLLYDRLSEEARARGLDGHE